MFLSITKLNKGPWKYFSLCNKGLKLFWPALGSSRMVLVYHTSTIRWCSFYPNFFFWESYVASIFRLWFKNSFLPSVQLNFADLSSYLTLIRPGFLHWLKTRGWGIPPQLCWDPTATIFPKIHQKWPQMTFGIFILL